MSGYLQWRSVNLLLTPWYADFLCRHHASSGGVFAMFGIAS